MFAVIKIAGQQFKVQAGQSLFVPHLTGKTGDKVEFSDILMLENEGKVSIGGDAKATVKAEIVDDTVKGDKVIAFKMKKEKDLEKARSSHSLHSNKSNRYYLAV